MPVVSTATRWRHTYERDEMRNANTHIACLDSTNELHFQFPYAGGSTAQLCFRQSPQFGFDAWVSIHPGQFTCFMGCRLRVKFDQGAVESFRGSGPAGGGATMVFVSGPARFVAEVQRAHRIVVEADFYQYGAQQIVFDAVDGLVWPSRAGPTQRRRAPENTTGRRQCVRPNGRLVEAEEGQTCRSLGAAPATSE